MENKENQIERRTITLKELRIIDELPTSNAEPVIEGYASVFDSWSEELGGEFPFRERVVKGAFEESIQRDDIRALFNHDPNYVLGRNTSNTLSLEEDEKGLRVRITPPQTQWAKDLLVSIKRGDITQMSFGFTVILDRWSYEDNIDIRELLKVKLYDVSPVTFPAYSQTECGIRTIFERHKEAQKSKDKNKRNLEIKKQKLKFMED
ncbi:MAG TPA: HK97 family phage prohead protease [Candidatus Caccovivens faecavium]|nr:HK97 family phage prohead protease [Candidatus Caccovivens faecavium]